MILHLGISGGEEVQRTTVAVVRGRLPGILDILTVCHPAPRGMSYLDMDEGRAVEALVLRKPDRLQ